MWRTRCGSAKITDPRLEACTRVLLIACQFSFSTLSLQCFSGRRFQSDSELSVYPECSTPASFTRYFAIIRTFSYFFELQLFLHSEVKHLCICLCVCILHNIKFYRTLHTNSFINLNFSVHLQCPSFLCSVHLDNVQKLLCMHNVLYLQTSFTNTVSSYGLVKVTTYCEIIYGYRCFIFNVFMFNCLILCHFYKKEWRNVLAVALDMKLIKCLCLFSVMIRRT